MSEGVTDFTHFQSSFDRIADNIETAIQGRTKSCAFRSWR
jgi:hypothetical protein